MFRYRLTLAMAVVFAFISAGSLGGGLIALAPVLKLILMPPKAETAGDPSATLAGQLRVFNEHLAHTPVIGGTAIRFPEEWIAALPEGRFEAVLLAVAVLGALTLIGATANFLHAWLSLTIVTNTVTSIRRSLFHHALHLPLRTVVRQSAADLTSRVFNDTTLLAGGFQTIVSKALAQLTKGAAALCAALILDWKLTAFTLVVVPPLALILRKLGKKIRRASRSAMKSLAGLLAVTNETLQGFRVVKVFTRERSQLGRFTAINENVNRELLRARAAKALATPLTEVISIFIIGLLAIVAAKAIIDGKLDPSRFFMVLGSLAVAATSLKPLAGLVQDIQQAEAGAQRINEILGSPLEDARDTKKPRLARHSRAIEFHDVTFAYDGTTTPALDRVSLIVPHGMRVAVVGPNGSGKTTLLSLIPRLFVPNSGSVFIDGIDIASVSLRSLRRQIAVVTQEVVLFRATITENIAFGAAGATKPTRGEIEAAARRAHAHEFIAAQPGGYETPVGDQGLTLSGGQRQRIAIARAIIRDPAILIMDEATSMIDSDSEAQIGEALAEFSKDRTCLIVAHRLSTVINADMIVVMDRGRIVDTGRHDELIDRCDVYRQLAQHQLQPGA
ncbi:MAG TPA: ABC transporter ATP-binding protein [Phycisphaerales bacterium]|nr:ABC transporter ATP-binding protein [Phycisphaerales bacterium]